MATRCFGWRTRIGSSHRVSCRRRSFSTVNEIVFRRIKIPSGVFGDTPIYIHNPPSSKALPLLLYIRPICVSDAQLSDDLIPRSFLSQHHTTVVISPTWSRTRPFPVPLHLISYAYYYLLDQHKLASEVDAEIDQDPLNPEPIVCPPISVYSSGIGGSLALSLALLECRPSESATGFIEAVMTRDSIFDFSPLTLEYLNTHVDRSKPDPEPIPDYMNGFQSLSSDLYYETPDIPRGQLPLPDGLVHHDISSKEATFRILPHLFSKPEVAYDSFVSPLLFFRGTDHSTPTNWSWTRPPRVSLTPTLIPNDRARSYLKFPPTDSGMRIPWTRLCVGGSISNAPEVKEKRKRSRSKKQVTNVEHASMADLFSEQAEMMAAAMRRSIDHNHEDPRDVGDLKDVGSDERVQVVMDGAGDDAFEADGVEMQKWLYDVTEWRGRGE